MIINFITDINNLNFIKDIDKIYNAFFIKYNSGNFNKNIYHYLDYDASYSNFNIFYGYINNLLLDKSSNNIFIYIPQTFNYNWISQLNLYNYIIIFHKKFYELNFFNNFKLYFIDFFNINSNIFHKSFMLFFKNISSIKIPSNILNTNNLPNVSICILTYNRPSFIDLFLHHFNNITYPKNKLEIIIIDDGNLNISHLLPNSSNIKYYKYNNKNTIAWKRNQAIKLSQYDIIAFMDDDDYYPPDSLLYRINYLLNSNKQCIFCSTIGCFHIYNNTSIINSTSIFSPLEKKVSEATLTFYKSFWINNSFNNNDTFNEGESFIKNKLHLCKDISFKNIIIQLLHKSNTIPKNINNYITNGSHFNFNNDIFKLFSKLKF